MGPKGSSLGWARDHDLLWAVYLEEPNPIVDIAVTGDRAVIRSAADVTVVLDSGSESFWPVAWSFQNDPWFGAVSTRTAAATATQSMRLGALVTSVKPRSPITG